MHGSVEVESARSTAGGIHDAEGRRGSRRLPFLLVLTAVVAIGFTALVAATVVDQSFFFGDDYLGFFRTEQGPFQAVLLVPIGSQIAPLHRVANALHYWIAPMSFEAAVAVLVVFHAVGAVYLYRALQLLEPSRVNLVLVGWYCSYVYILPTLVWWSSALQRAPYVALAVMAVYYYRRWTTLAERRSLVATCLCFAAALLFYSKAVLLPACFVALDVATRSLPTGGSSEDVPVRKRLVVWLALSAVGVAYVLVSIRLMDAPLGHAFGRLDGAFQLEFQKRAFSVLAHGALAAPLSCADYEPHAWVAATWLAAAAYTIYRSRTAALAWLAGGTFIALNFAMIGMSNRTALFGLRMACEPRYFYELAFPVALFVGAAVHAIPRDAPEVRWTGRGRGRRVAEVAAAVALAGYAAVSYRASSAMFERDGEAFRRTARYMETLEGDLDALLSNRPEPPNFADGPLPTYINPLDPFFRRHSQLFTLLHVDARFVPKLHAEFAVAPDGSVVRVAGAPKKPPRAPQP